jgi:asparagine synthase (glutamine-hydrolysing)
VTAIQALPLLESGAADRYGFTPADLALACSSHSGTPLHVDAVRGMLTKAGIDSDSLECGTHWPFDDASARALARTGAEPCPLHNNCSGKHAGFLATARHLGVEHYPHIVTGEAVAADLDNILAGLDQPTGDGLNTYYASRAARAGGVTVALSGLGADELFGGYPSFRRLPRLARWLPIWQSLPAPLRRLGLAALAAGDTSARKLGASLAAGSPAALALIQRAVLADDAIARLLAPSAAALGFQASSAHPATPALAAAWAAALAARQAGATPPYALLASLAETTGYMADLLLRDSDEFSMRHSLELRVPFVDLPLVEWAWAQDPALLYPRGAAPKAHLAAACADLLPPALLTRAKRGFTLPFSRWLRGPLRPFMEETLGSASAARSGLFDPYVPGQLWRAFRDGRDDRAWSRVWSLAILIHLANRGANA